jgi:hypothetical protein
MDAGIFPITEREAAVLHDLKWQSGFGWRDEWDWWPHDQDHTAADDESVRLMLIRHVLSIRASVRAAEDLALRVLSTQ